MILTLVAILSAIQTRQPEIATAASSSNLNFQARLLNSAGNVVPDGYYNIEFKIYNASTSSGSSQGSCAGDANCVWTETYYDSNGVTAGNDNRLRVVNGYLSANLGSISAFASTINWDQEHWITMNIGGSTQTATPTYDGEMSPRLKLTAVPYAFKAGELAKTTGGNVSTLKFDTQTAANNILLPDEAGTLCIRSSTNCGFAASSGSANYIQNSTAGQTANFNIQSAANTSVVGVLQGAASQSADLLQFKDSSGVILTAFDSAGRLVFGPSGSQDTNLYRDSANTLKTDDNLVVGGTLSVTGTQTFTAGGTFNGGLTVANDSNFSQTGTGTFGTGTGAVSLNGNTTISSGSDFTITGGTGSQFTNNSSTLNTALALGDLAAGALGVNTATVDIKTSFTIAPTVAGRTYTIPSPTDTTAGRIIYISNVHGSNNFIIGSATFNSGTTGSFVWDGTAWRAAGIDTGVTTVGALNGGTANANGATITGTTIYQQSASTSFAGLVDTTTQSFTGDKTFKSTTNSTTAFQIQDTASSSLLTADTTNLALSVTSRSSSGVAVNSQNDGRAFTIDTTSGNFVKNGSFETDVLNWTNMTRTSGAGVSSPGDYYAAFPASDWLNGSSVNAVANLTGNLATSTTYTLTFYAQSIDSFSAQPTITASFGGSNCAGVTPAVGSFSSASWVRYTCTITTGVGTYNTITFNDAIAANAFCLFGCNPKVLIDGVRLEVGSTATAYKYGNLTSNVDTKVQTSINSNTAFLVQNAAGTSILNTDTINGSVSVASSRANGIFSAGSSIYSTGTITQSTTSITGSGTTFTQNMSGGTIYYPDGTSSVVTYVSGTSLTSSVSKTVTAGSSYILAYGGLTVKSGGATYVQPTTNSTSAFLVQNATGTSVLSVDSTNGRIGINTSAPSGDLTFGENATRTINVLTRTTNAAGSALTISAGAAGSGASAFAGGALTLQGGAAGGTGNANGGDVTISGGAAVGATGYQGLVNLSSSAFTSAPVQTIGTTGVQAITAGNQNIYSTLPINATVSGVIATIGDPGQSVIGRVLYISARSGSSDFTLRLNSARTPIDIAMKQNSTATLIWNGTDWTAAGASSSTDLQSAYNNTLTSAGGAELVLNAPGGNADGLTIRNNATTPITGGILEVQTSIGSNLFSVNNNATEYATNGGAETQGASASTFPASTWIAAPAGGTVSRNTTAANNATGTASVSVVTTTTSHGAADTLSGALTANLQYTVSFTVKGATNFSALDVIYSRDGTNTSTTSCATGKTVTTSVWSRITCTFTAPSSGITSGNAIFIRQSDATGRTFYVDNLSVNVNASVNHAADGSVDSALGTNWTDFGTNGSGTTTVVRNTSLIYDTSGSVEKTTGATANKGIRNNLPITPSVSTQYLVTFYGRSSDTFSDVTAGFLPAGGDTAPISAQLCTDYNTQTITSSGWTKITCIVTTPSSGISDPDIVIYQPTGTARTFYVDALTVTLNTNTASNVQVGQGNKGGPTTLFTLDRSSTAPIADNNDAYLGSMYYDTTSGRIQCYEADGWGACGAAPDNIVNLNPEFAGAVLNGSGVGTMSADFCGNGGGLSVNTGLCSSGQARNYYKWTSPQASQQTYSIYVTYQLPASFKNFASDDTVQLTARTDSTSNGIVTYEMFRNESGSISACGSETTVTSVVDTWQTVGVNGNESTSCGFGTSSGNAFVIFKINVKANSNANVYVGTLGFTTQGR